MKPLAKAVGLLALATMFVVPLLRAFQILEEPPMKVALLLATVAWFATAPFWLKGGDV